jgi:hypothetical protein
MPAYLARQLRLLGFSADTALAVNHVLGIGYEYKSRTFGKDHTKIFTEQRDHYYIRTVQKSILLHTLGAMWAMIPDMFRVRGLFNFAVEYGAMVATTPSVPPDRKKKYLEVKEPKRFLAWRFFLNGTFTYRRYQSLLLGRPLSGFILTDKKSHKEKHD